LSNSLKNKENKIEDGMGTSVLEVVIFFWQVSNKFLYAY
jgi:hypothetical protein